MEIPRVEYGGITDINTAKSIARKLFQTYSQGDAMEPKSMERMLIDTYKVMVWNCLTQNKGFAPTTDDLTLYSDVLDKNSDGRVTI
jgi:hypothetical protein